MTNPQDTASRISEIRAWLKTAGAYTITPIARESIEFLLSALEESQREVGELRADKMRLDCLETGLLDDAIIEGYKWDTRNRKPHFVYFTDNEIAKSKRYEGDTLRQTIDAVIKGK